MSAKRQSTARFALAFSRQIFTDECWAHAGGVQLLAEYAPEPPFDAGTPARAPAEVTKMMEDMFVEFVRNVETVGADALAKAKQL